ncbi:MAG TPA: TonB-dependent receptor [Candidatus Acidoferrum sp.]|nr:TonB-dependent receptor [Candidatus Acidoferrum sp.]
MLYAYRFVFGSLSIFLLLGFSSFAQERRAAISGHVTDTNGDPLVGARVELQPLGQTAATDAQGQFAILDVAPGKYTLTVSYVGFKSYSKDVTVASGGSVNEDAVLAIETVNEQVIVRGEREHGEIEALNREITADNIVQVLPAEVITSLPNTNIADALGRMPSVSLERDEGEGKYVQIRGTEPRLSNVTIDGVHVPSPEGVRNVKLDAIPADLVDSVEINKTLSANQEGDAIGGSVNLVTKKPTEQPYISLSAMGGFTPISGGRTLDQFGGTFGKRFGNEKRFGFLLGGSYDHNNRAINDVEPVPGVLDFGVANGGNQGVFFGEDIRQYWYDRTRFGFAGSADYKLGTGSLVYGRGLFSQFYDNGENWNYTVTPGNFITPTTTDNTGSISMNDFHRTPQQQIFDLTVGANHTFGPTLITYEFSGGRAKYDGGFQFANWSGPSGVQFGVDTSKSVVPRFPVQNGVNIYDPTQYQLGFLLYPWDDHIHERDFSGSITLSRQYQIHSRFGVFEMGFKARDADKVRTGGRSFRPYTGATAFPMSSALKTVPNYSFYFGLFTPGPLSDYSKISQFVNSNPGSFPDDPVSDQIGNDPNHYDTGERVLAGYVMNTITLGHVRLQGGLRFEGTQGSFVGNTVTITTDPVTGNTVATTVPVKGMPSYVDVLPSIQFQYMFFSNTKLRLAYGRGIARPNFSDLPPFAVVDQTSTPTGVQMGNPNLKPTHANDFDILFEHYLKTVGIIQAGWFYKAMTDPIFSVTSSPTTGPFAGDRVTGPINGPSAHLMGIEMAWEQHLKFLPGLLNGVGVSANYSYTTSRVSFPTDFGRTDHPALLRQAPNNWNFDTTYDKGPISARMGLTHNDANIWSYQFQDSAPLGIKGPLGDQYLYPHTQVDAQVSYRIPRAHGTQAIVSLLNLNNEVFGFYFGSEKYPIQREYYNRTVSLGLRWTSGSGDLK